MIIPSRICIPGFLLVLWISLGAVTVMGQDVRITVNPDQDFSKYQRYAWKENRIASVRFPENRKAIEEKIKDVINGELSKKGYEEDAQNPDFYIEVDAASIPGDLMTSANRDLRVPSNVTVYNSQSPGGPGVSIWMTLTAGALVTVTDSASNKTAWEAKITKKYKNPDSLRNKLDKEINNFFKKGLKKFPENKNK
jgi:Domain of unknown function (DUF4136)